MNDRGGVSGRASRRQWLAHCSVLALLAAGACPGSAAAQGSRPAAPILVLGDSLSAEYGLTRGSGWVALLGKRLTEHGVKSGVVNASISGETTSGGRSRLAALLRQHRPSVVILELGGNDALRGLPLAMTRDNLAQMARDARAAGAKVLVVGMQVPPNYGRKYSDDFAALFADVANSEDARLVPFLLSGVADGADAAAMFQPDRIHPVAAAQPKMLDNVWAVLKTLVK